MTGNLTILNRQRAFPARGPTNGTARRASGAGIEIAHFPGRAFLISDVQSEGPALRKMVEEVLRPDRRDWVIGVGDLFDGERPGIEPILIWEQWQRAGQFQLAWAEGNHDYYHENYAARIRAALLAPAENAEFLARMAKRPGGFLANNQLLTEEHLAFLRALPPWIRLPHDQLVTHGGIPPRVWKHGKLAPSELSRTQWEKLQFDHFKTVRYYDPTADDHLVGTGKLRDHPHARYWALDYPGTFGLVYFGHQRHYDRDSMQGTVTRYPHAMALDTGAGKGDGGYLTAVELLPDGSIGRIFQIRTDGSLQVSSGKLIPHEQATLGPPID